MQAKLSTTQQEVAELRAAVDSAKETILSQNEHISGQSATIRQLRQKNKDAENNFQIQIQEIQEKNEDLRSQMEKAGRLLFEVAPL